MQTALGIQKNRAVVILKRKRTQENIKNKYLNPVRTAPQLHGVLWVVYNEHRCDGLVTKTHQIRHW